MKQYLLDTFKYNDFANRKALEKIRLLPEGKECVRLFSHLVNSMNKWMARIMQDPDASKMSWWEPAYLLDDLEFRWNECLQKWLNYLEARSEEEIDHEVFFTGFDGGTFAAKIKDIALQLCYHSIHHRAQMQMLIREQGIEPEFVDYIGTAYRKL